MITLPKSFPHTPLCDEMEKHLEDSHLSVRPNPKALIHRYCRDNAELEYVLLVHSLLVAEAALEVAEINPQLNLDRQFLYEAAMLHDIGIAGTDAPSIHCHGTEPYLRHGVLGADILRSEGFPRHARVAERHTGTGLTASSIVASGLSLPAVDLVPETLEEQVICYADKFYSKTRLMQRKSVEQITRSLNRFGPECASKFLCWHEQFCLPC